MIPLTALSALGATALLTTDVQGQQTVTLTWSRSSRRVDQRKGAAILARFTRLLMLQLDVSPGQRPRTVQQLVACGRIMIDGKRYKLR